MIDLSTDKADDNASRPPHVAAASSRDRLASRQPRVATVSRRGRPALLFNSSSTSGGQSLVARLSALHERGRFFDTMSEEGIMELPPLGILMSELATSIVTSSPAGAECVTRVIMIIAGAPSPRANANMKSPLILGVQAAAKRSRTQRFSAIGIADVCPNGPEAHEPDGLMRMEDKGENYVTRVRCRSLQKKSPKKTFFFFFRKFEKKILPNDAPYFLTLSRDPALALAQT
jgi:hypothetical protein